MRYVPVREGELDSLRAQLISARSEADALRAQLGEAVKEREEARDWVRRMHRETQVLTCVYCGKSYPPRTPASGSEALTAHIKVCPKHPLAQATVRAESAERQLSECRKALENLVDEVTGIEAWDGDCPYLVPPIEAARAALKGGG
jgi:hypothetical protein